MNTPDQYKNVFYETTQNAGVELFSLKRMFLPFIFKSRYCLYCVFFEKGEVRSYKPGEFSHPENTEEWKQNDSIIRKWLKEMHKHLHGWDLPKWKFIRKDGVETWEDICMCANCLSDPWVKDTLGYEPIFEEKRKAFIHRDLKNQYVQ